MPKVRSLIYSAYRHGAILRGPRRGLSASQYADGLDLLNVMLDSWRAERLMVPSIVRAVFNVTPNHSPYTIGPYGCDLTADWPERIEAAGMIYTNATPASEVPMRILTPQEFQDYSPKDLKSSVSTMLYYDRSYTGATSGLQWAQATMQWQDASGPWSQANGAAPSGKIYLLPIPNTANQFSLYLWQALRGFASIDDEFVMPPAYQGAIEYNLAVELSPRNPNFTLSPLVISLARSKKLSIKSINAEPLLMRTELMNQGVTADRGAFNIFSNSYNPRN